MLQYGMRRIGPPRDYASWSVLLLDVAVYSNARDARLRRGQSERDLPALSVRSKSRLREFREAMPESGSQWADVMVVVALYPAALSGSVLTTCLTWMETLLYNKCGGIPSDWISTGEDSWRPCASRTGLADPVGVP